MFARLEEAAKRQDVGCPAMNILGLSGSLRVASINSMLLRATARLAPRDINVSIFNGSGELPLFNPDLEAILPANVVTFRRAVADADALLLASPEYAHTGTIKRMLPTGLSVSNRLPPNLWQSSTRHRGRTTRKMPYAKRSEPWRL
jgi:hypothetical protein